MRSLLVIDDCYPSSASAPDNNADVGQPLPTPFLRSHGYHVKLATDEAQALEGAETAEAVVYHLSVRDIRRWNRPIEKKKRMPRFWWCSSAVAARSLEACEDDLVIDGLLAPSMSDRELHWALHWGIQRFYQREQWHWERQELLAKVEERKWIEAAKRILGEIKRISEAEAYELLRKQAMDERKRMIDVATSIVKVYELLQDAKPKGTKRK